MKGVDFFCSHAPAFKSLFVSICRYSVLVNWGYCMRTSKYFCQVGFSLVSFFVWSCKYIEDFLFFEVLFMFLKVKSLMVINCLVSLDVLMCIDSWDWLDSPLAAEGANFIISVCHLTTVCSIVFNLVWERNFSILDVGSP